MEPKQVQQRRWKADINARLDASLLLSSVNLVGGELRRRSEQDELAMRKYLVEGDLISAEVQNLYNDGSSTLHTRLEEIPTALFLFQQMRLSSFINADLSSTGSSPRARSSRCPPAWSRGGRSTSTSCLAAPASSSATTASYGSRPHSTRSREVSIRGC